MPSDVAISSGSIAPPGPFRAFWSAFSENRGAVLGLFVVAVIVFIALLAPFLAPHDPFEQFKGATKLPPFWMEHADPRFWLGTDAVGRDMLSRLMFGSRVSLFIGLSVMVVSMLVGIALGLAAAWFGGIIDVTIIRIMDLIMAIPSLVLAILIIAIIGPSLTNTIIAVTIVYLPRYVRLLRASALSELTKDYVTAAKVAGVGPFRLMTVTVLPNCLAVSPMPFWKPQVWVSSALAPNLPWRNGVPCWPTRVISCSRTPGSWHSPDFASSSRSWPST
jgi:dipeptide transport system permease protein